VAYRVYALVMHNEEVTPEPEEVEEEAESEAITDSTSVVTE
jgi:hypothetical protein